MADMILNIKGDSRKSQLFFFFYKQETVNLNK